MKKCSVCHNIREVMNFIEIERENGIFDYYFCSENCIRTALIMMPESEEELKKAFPEILGV